MRLFHRLCAALSRGGGRDFALSFLPSSFPPSTAISPSPSIAVSSFFLSLFPLSSSVPVLLPLDHLALPSRSPLALFHPLQSPRSRFYSGSQLRISPSQICRPSFLHNFDAPHQGLPHPPSYSSTSSSPYSSHHVLPRGQHAPAHGSYTHAHGAHTLPRSPRVIARSSCFCGLLSPRAMTF